MKFCPKCEKQCGVKRIEIEEEYKYKGKTFTISRLVDQCIFCGEEVGSDEEDQKVINGIKRRIGE